MASIEANISMSLDGFVTGPNINEYPGLGEGGDVLHDWVNGADQAETLRWNLFDPAGAVVTSRKVFEDAGGWGEDGFYRMPVFVVTHRPHEVIVKGKTTFTFVTEGVEHAIAQAAAAAGERKVHVMGGASIVQQALKAGLVDELFLHVAPVILGDGTPLFDHVGGPIRLESTEVVESQSATHLRFRVVK
ncbi:dihydrofolate reductase family protein [Actinomadura rubrisoli]|uniref:Dihydrofolate reductase n=1 Tax=Actinomadura rubrisoli TaxID=2530368 RepID=A0A4R5B265_9ACTN|nr:dihydrofolate reductase family protein [Actinomadura rubrisoli]TDD77634.1 dihydrofolate reductase [Actinomadura rubrisoli]